MNENSDDPSFPLTVSALALAAVLKSRAWFEMNGTGA